MNPIQGATDSKHQVKLQSALEQVLWTAPIAAVGGVVGLEIFTHFVGNASDIEIELSDNSGKNLGKYKEKISGNRFWTKIRVPAEARQALYANVKLPKHGLQMKSSPLILLPPIEITNAKWDKKEARRGDILKLTADVKGVPDGTEGEIEIWEHDSDGAHDFITKFPVFVKDKKVEADWEYEYHEDTDEIPTEEELKKYGNHYNPPEYFFRVKINGLAADSDLLLFKDWIELELVDGDGEPVGGKRYVLNLANGSIKEGKLDGNGRARIEDLPPGAFLIKYIDAFPEDEEVYSEDQNSPEDEQMEEADEEADNS